MKRFLGWLLAWLGRKPTPEVKSAREPKPKPKPEPARLLWRESRQPERRAASGALGRADLLRGLWLAEQHGAAEQDLALTAGYVLLKIPTEDKAGGLSPTPSPSPSSALPMSAQSVPDGPGATDLRDQALQAEQRARFWAVTERVALNTTALADEDCALLDLPELLGEPDQPVPPWQAIAPNARMMPALKRSLQTQRTGALDIDQLLDAVVRRKSLRHLPRRALKGWTGRLLLVLDIGAALQPYREDIQRLVRDLRRWVGPGKVEVRLVCDQRHPLGPWQAWQAWDCGSQWPEPDPDPAPAIPAAPNAPWHAAASDTRIMLVSELGLLANDGGRTALAWAAWFAVVGRQGAQSQVWCPLPIGQGPFQDRDQESDSPTAPENEAQAGPMAAAVLPRIPVVHWSAASRLRPRPLPNADLHRSPERLEIARQLRIRLALAASVAPRLLRALRLDMGPPALDAGLEQLVWDHPDLTHAVSARAIKSASLGEHRAEFEKLPAAQKCSILDIMLAHHRPSNPLLAYLETLAWASYATSEECALRRAPIARAQDVMQRFAQRPWQFGDDLPRPRVCDFMARYLRDADERTRAFCSPVMSRMWVALHRQRHGDSPMTESYAGLAAADLASALGVKGTPQAYWLTLDHARGCLILSHGKPRESRLLEPRVIVLRMASIRIGGQAPRLVVAGDAAQAQPRDIGLARLPWGTAQRVGGKAVPLLVDGPICLETDSERLTITEVVRSGWALEWGRDRQGLYALAPNPCGLPLRIGYPLAKGAVAQVAWSGAQPQGRSKGEAELRMAGLTLDIDHIGLLAKLELAGGQGQTFRYIAAGDFMMGSVKTEAERWDHEGPQHRVTIGAGFWLADTACTQGLWQAVMGANPSHFNKEEGGGPEHPVEKVSWWMVQEFLQKLQVLLPTCHIGLPTEAEWEYACRAGSVTPFSFGNVISTEQVNYNGNYPYDNGEKGEYRGHTVAVKDLPANAWGLYQMHGNVWEWCADRWRDYGVEALLDPGLAEALHPPLDDKSAARVLRGGGWLDYALNARSAFRFLNGPDGLNRDTGLRLALRSRSPASRPEA